MSIRLPGRGPGAFFGLAIGALLLAACSSGEPTEVPSEWPTGTVLAVNGEAILESEIDAHVDAILDLENAFVLEQRRRLVLINIGLPLAYARSLDAERRQQARKSAQDAHARLASGELETPFGSELLGNWDQISLEVWLVARDLDPGELSGVVELPGRFAVIQVEARDHNQNRALEGMRLRIQTFPFVDSVPKLNDDFLQHELEIIDPAWHEIVPGYIKYKMKAAL